jgi:hypothetical protein
MKSAKEELAELATAIDSRLKAIEKSGKKNKNGHRAFYGAGAYADRGFVHVCYVSYQGSSKLRREQASAYLNWLNDGNAGTHHQYEYKHPHVLDDTFCTFPEESYRPKIGDPLVSFDYESDTYLAVVTAYFELLNVAFPALNTTKKQSKYDGTLIPKLKDFYPRGISSTHHCLTKEQQDAATKLYEQINLAIDKAFARGLAHGRNLLNQLARGEVTVGSFEKPLDGK